MAMIHLSRYVAAMPVHSLSLTLEFIDYGDSFQ